MNIEGEHSDCEPVVAQPDTKIKDTQNKPTNSNWVINWVINWRDNSFNVYTPDDPILHLHRPIYMGQELQPPVTGQHKLQVEEPQWYKLLVED